MVRTENVQRIWVLERELGYLVGVEEREVEEEHIVGSSVSVTEGELE